MDSCQSTQKGSFIKLREENGGLLTIVPPGSKMQKTLDEASIKVSSNDCTDMITRKLFPPT